MISPKTRAWWRQFLDALTHSGPSYNTPATLRQGVTVLSPAHHYVSTACYHMRHADCRLTCKYCPTPSPCRCPCHVTSNVYMEEMPKGFFNPTPEELDTPDAA